MKIVIAFCCLCLVIACNNKKTETEVTNDDSINTNLYDSTTNNLPGDSIVNSNLGPFDPADTSFVTKAAIGGQEEVDLANMAAQQAESDRVKQFASMMLRDHGQANAELSSIASSHGFTLPSILPSDMQADKDKLSQKKGKDFDRSYMLMMVSDHRKDLAMFEKASKDARTPDLKSFIDKILPTLRTHLDSAMAVQRAVK